jgi:hypothetical protein
MRKKGLRTVADIYLTDVSRRWKRAIRGADRVIVLSPYLSKTVETVLGSLDGGRCEVYTVFRAENFVSGASSLHTMIRLRERGCALYHLDDLHAKIVLVPGSFVSIGSQNATRRGTRNKEASSVFASADTVAAVDEMIKPWLTLGKPVTAEMLDEMNLAIRALIPLMRKLRRACNALDTTLWDAETKRAEERERLERERQRQEQLRLAEEARRVEFALNVQSQRQKLDTVIALNTASSKVARQLVEASAWWLTHRYGPTRAPNHQYNVYGSGGQWAIDFGANTLDLSMAIDISVQLLRQWLDQKIAGEDVSLTNLSSGLESAVRGSVRHQNGRYYDDYPAWDGYLRFGGTGIHMRSFVRRFLELTGTSELFPD